MNPEQLMEIQDMSWTIANCQAQPGYKRKPSQVRKESPMFALTLDTFRIKVVPPDHNAFRYFYKFIYDWSDVMTTILSALNDFKHVCNFSDVEDFIEDDLKYFFNTFRGWGLVQNLLPREKRNMFLLAMRLRALQGRMSQEECWMFVRNMFEQQTDFDYSRLIPDFEVSISEEEFEENDSGRKKVIELNLHKKGQVRYSLKVMFFVEKKRTELSLVNVAAEALAKMVEYEHDIKNLAVSGEIPRTLSEPFRIKFIDQKWIKGDLFFDSLNEVQNFDEFEEVSSEEMENYETADEGDTDDEWETPD